MSKDFVSISVKIDAKIFKRFAWYDTLHIRRRWKAPCLFSLILLVSSVLCYIQTQKEQSVLLGTVLLVIGLGLPLFYFAHYALQLRETVKRMQLKWPRPVYTLTFDRKHVRIENDAKKEDPVTLPWKNILGVWENHGDLYLYANAVKAFILPAGQAECGDAELKEFIAKHLDNVRVHYKK